MCNIFFKDDSSMDHNSQVLQTLEQRNFEHYLQQTDYEFNDEWLDQMVNGLFPEL